MCELKISQLLSMSNAITGINKSFAVNNSALSCLALIFNASNPRTTILQAKNWFKVAICAMSDTFFFAGLIQMHGLLLD